MLPIDGGASRSVGFGGAFHPDQLHDKYPYHGVQKRVTNRTFSRDNALSV